MAARKAKAPEYGPRDVTGLAAPYGVTGRGSAGLVRFSRGGLRWSDEHPTPLLMDHDATQPVGVITSLSETDEGLVFTGTVDVGPRGDDVLARLSSQSRTGVSVGVDLDDAAARNVSRSGRSAAEVTGVVREVSFTAVPAFESARASAPGLTPDTVPSVSVDMAATAGQGTGNLMTTTGSERFMTTTYTPEPGTDDAPAEDTGRATPGPAPTEPAPASTEPAAVATHSAPAAPPRAGRTPGAGLVTASRATVYDAPGQSLVLDTFAAAQYGDGQARERLAQFGAELATFAVEDSSDHSEVIPPGYRGDLLVRAIDRGRPIVSRMSNRVTLANATPFTIPVEGDFADVAVHTEGTAHATEGALTLSEVTVTPRAVSGAWRASRELLDASNPAIDQIAVRAMQRDYRVKSEVYAVARLAASTGAATALSAMGAGGPSDLVDALFTFYDSRDAAPPVIFMGNGVFNDLATDELSSGEPRFPTVNASNREGTSTGLDGLNIRGVLGVKSPQVAARELFLVYPEDVLWGESQLLTFRFEEVEGPGIVKFALWAYQTGQVLRAAGVKRYSIAAAA